MPRADGSFKVLEKINEKAYKLDLPTDFGVSPTFNITDLKPYLGEEDELQSRTSKMQEGRMMWTSTLAIHPHLHLCSVLFLESSWSLLSYASNLESISCRSQP
jgi:hypothetical protein